MLPFCLWPKVHPWFYNQAMRSALLLPLFLSCLSVCWAQLPAQATPPVEGTGTSAAAAGGAVEKRIEVIQIEDAGARIDELRVGGETKTITVQPKGRMPSYEVQPVTGERRWKILGF
jgi:hypothetical protein